ncbi:NAD(P)H-dependent oxidoreductase [Flagellimonas meridianipacifica]|uniref:Nitroreductase n=1 Tax=Flagellimonas meridianipacifica TaxID=1080225 RepID=A0A2T0M6P4_9FLAO|nr:NAD(P)H-dependent oxidoreductase [Allomuricauda pacifica]PRX53126.1 nitroreductase [Allomuricauda pacifica]
MSTTLENLNWRYATKKFDADKKISSQDLDTILKAIQLSPSSYGLQPYHILVITDEALRKELQPASWNQSQIVDASHLLVFAAKSEFGSELIDDYLQNVVDTRGVNPENLKGYGDFMKSKLLDLPNNIKTTWTSRQAYIAAQSAMLAAAELKIDTCPMEGFEPAKYDEILGLKDKGLTSVVVLTVGYRSEEDDTQNYPKVRKSNKELFTHI